MDVTAVSDVEAHRIINDIIIIHCCFCLRSLSLAFGENVSRDEFLDFIRSLVDFLSQNNTQQQFDALSFEYTYWPDVTNGPENRKRALNVIFLVTVHLLAQQRTAHH